MISRRFWWNGERSLGRESDLRQSLPVFSPFQSSRSGIASLCGEMEHTSRSVSVTSFIDARKETLYDMMAELINRMNDVIWRNDVAWSLVASVHMSMAVR